MKRDTIVAISTPHGVGGIAVVRLSGPEALTLALRHLAVDSLAPRRATYCRLDNLDDVVALFLPIGYSGEPTVEISCHGSLYVQQAVLQLFVDDGARLAEPGEFTRRAFLNGRLDLSQAEAVADLIDSVSPAQHRLAVSQLRGGYAQKLKELRRQLLDLTSLLELELDFSQEDVEFADRSQLRHLLSTFNLQLSSLIDSFRLGNALKQGVPVAIIGKPNVGKSTLLNTLLQDDRAIVSDIPGTTRDTVEGLLTIGSVTFRLVDTAGLRETTDAVERLGIERSRKACDDAFIVLHLFDSVEDIPRDLPSDDKHHIFILNKTDLHPFSIPNSQISILHISALTGTGIDNLKQALLDAVGGRTVDETLLSNVRHRDALQHVLQAVTLADKSLADGIPADLVAVDLRDALYHLGTITGEVTSDELLGNIFGRFCIGK